MPGFAFDGKNPAAQEVAARQAGRLITGIADQTREMIRAMVVRSIREGIPPRDLARLMRPALGLTAQQGQGLLNYRQSLLDVGTKASEVERLADKYSDKKVAERAETVARTEVMDALNDGALESWKQARDEGLVGDNMVKEVIVTDDDLLCPVCAPMDAVRVPIDSPFETENGPVLMPPFHPNCRCTAVMIPDDVPEREPQEAAQEVMAQERTGPDAAVTDSLSEEDIAAGYVEPIAYGSFDYGTTFGSQAEWRAHEEAQAALAIELLKAKGYTVELPAAWHKMWGRTTPRPISLSSLKSDQLERVRVGLDTYLKAHQTLLSAGVDMAAKEYKLGRITFDTSYQKNAYAYAEARYFGGKNGEHQVVINLNCDAWGNKGRMRNSMQRDFDIGFHPVANYESIVVHEFGHISHYANGADVVYLKGFRWGRDYDGVRIDIGVARQVSRYATANPLEFVAETWTGLVYGKQYSPEVMRMYEALKGKVPSQQWLKGTSGPVQKLAPKAAPPPPPVPKPVLPPKPPGPPKPKGGPVTQEEIIKVLELRKQGLSYEAIEKAMGWPPRHGSKAFQIVKKYGQTPPVPGPGPVPPPPVPPPKPPVPVPPPKPPGPGGLPPVQYPPGWAPKPNTPPEALQVIHLKLSGKTYEQIEQIMGWPPRHGSKPWTLYKKWGPPK